MKRLKQQKLSRYAPALLVIVIVGIGLGYYLLYVSRAATLNADVNSDGTINILDLSIVASNYGKSGRNYSQGNIDGDGNGNVNISDLSILASQWGQSKIVPAYYIATNGNDSTGDGSI